MNSELNKTVLKSRVGRNITALFVVCALIPLSALAVLSLTQVSTQIREEANKEIKGTAKSTGMSLIQRLRTLETDLMLVAEHLQEGEGPIPRAMHSRLGDRFAALALLKEGEEPKPLIRDWIPTIGRVSDKEWTHLEENSSLLRTVPGTRGVADSILIRAVQPRDRSAGLLIALAERRFLWHSNEMIPDGGWLVVVDEGTGRRLFDATVDIAPGGLPASELLKAKQKSPASGRFPWTANDEEYFAGYWQLFMGPFKSSWTILYSKDKEVVMLPLQSFQTLFLLATALSFSFVVILSLIQIRRTLKPIIELHQATLKVAEGDFSHEVQIESDDEFADLGNSFNLMVAEITENIRRREQTEWDLAAARDAAIAAAETEVRFVSNITHELKTPLTGILSYSEMLGQYEDIDENTKSEFIDIITKEAKHLNNLIDDVLQLSSLQHGLKHTDRRKFQLESNLKTAATQLEEDETARVTIDLGGKAPSVVGDPELLQRMWFHLLKNAALYSAPNSPIEVRVSCESDSVVVEVSDHGIGIEPCDIDMIFERFHQVGDDVLTDKNKGTGLGLAIAKDVVELHDGTIEVESEPKHGTTFRVTLPLQSAKAARRTLATTPTTQDPT